MHTTVSAVILAAGCSKRMGTLKQLLKLKDDYLIEKVINNVLTMEEFTSVITVIGSKADRIIEAVHIKDERFRWLYNIHFERGQGTSLKIGLMNALQDSDGVMVFLGDAPFVKHDTIQEIVETGKRLQRKTTESFLLQPTFQGIPGHPVYFGNLSHRLLNTVHGDDGTKGIKRNIKLKKRMPVNDFGVTFDLDTPEIFEQAKKLIQ